MHMRRLRRATALLLAALLALSLFACSSSSNNTGGSTTGQNNSGQTDDSQGADAGTVEFTDGIGRTVTIPTPENLERIYADSTNSDALLYILAPDLMTASPTGFTEEDLPYVMEGMVGLPSYGTMSGSNGVLDYEAIKAADVQLIVTTVQGNEPTDSDIQSADDLQEQLGIPVISFSTQLESLDETFTLLGQALGHEEEAAVIVEYFDAIVEKVTSVVAEIPEEERMTLYYAEGKDGLATEPGLWYTPLHSDAKSRSLQAMLGEEKAGHVAFHREGQQLVITDYQLLPALRGRRFGAQLMGQAVQFARSCGCEAVTLTCGADLAGYFAQFGFVETGRQGDSVDLSLDIRLILQSE